MNNKINFDLDLLHLLDQIPHGIIIFDLEKRVLFLNTYLEVFLGTERDKLLGKKCYQVLRSNCCLDRCLMKTIDKNEYQEANLINYYRELKKIRQKIAPLVDKDGNIVAYLESIEELKEEEKLSQGEFSNILGNCPKMKELFALVPIVAKTDSAILITGETGTGKDLLAEAIHQHSFRKDGPFIKVNCGALPENLLESELFGYKKGAFTGATTDKPGWFKLAHKGTIFLTEIGDLPLSLQVKLLSFLDDQVIYPLGSTRGIEVDVRVIAATHRDLRQMIKEKKFREDLFFRLNVVRLALPPLRERGEDIKELLYYFLNFYNKKLQKKIKEFSLDALRFLLSYRYPGNVRELRNIVEYSVAVCMQEKIGLEDLPAYLKEYTAVTPQIEKKEVFSPEKEDNFQDLEKNMILEALKQCRGKKSEAAKYLGWSRSKLWRKMKFYRI
ncbi:MAG: two-component system, NtrC family, response regulator AtoC [Desulfonauticus sp.]|nr:two-component system, NtrC family, response regulator AtoC [Desulfonauticus sp.]